MVRAVMLVLGIAFTHNLYAKPLSLDVSKFHRQYLAENRVLLYIGKHMQSDKVAIWGQAAFTEDIVRVLLESPLDVGQMEELLRSSGNSWEGDYDNYRLYDFMLSEVDQSDSFFAQVVKNSSELTPLDGYVDRIEEVDGVTKFFDKHSKEVFPVGKGKISKCAMAEGDACYLLYRSFLDYENLVQAIKPQEKELIAYFEENKHLLEGDGIVNTEIVEELGFKNVTALGWARRKLKKKLSEDTDHFIHKIVSEQRMVDDVQVRYYRFADTTTRQEKELIAYLEENMELLRGEGIVNTEIIEKFGFKGGIGLGHAISRLKKRLFEDTAHFIHKIVHEQRIVDDKTVSYYRFADNTTRQEKELIAYFEKNQHLLEGEGIVNTEIVEKLGFTSGIGLGKVIGRLKKELSEDTDHFIYKIVHEQRRVDDKKVSYYRFADNTTRQEKELIAYLEENMELLEGEGIVIAEMAEVLGFKNGTALGQVIRSLKKTLSEDTAHIIHKIVSELRMVDDKKVSYYRFTDAMTFKEKELIAYLEENKHLLEGDGIVIAEMAEDLGFKSGHVLGKVIGSLKKRLSKDTDHIFHKIVRERRWAGDKHVNYYRFADAITRQEKELIAYLEENMELLEGEGIVNTEIIEKLGFTSGIALGYVIGRLKKELSEDTDHFIHRIVSKAKTVEGEYINFYHITPFHPITNTQV